MWHVIYLGLVNVVVGVTTSVVIRRRAQWVRQQMDDGYDFDKVHPPSLLSKLPFFKPSPVDVAKLCQTIAPDCDVQAEWQLVETQTHRPAVHYDQLPHSDIDTKVVVDERPQLQPSSATSVEEMLPLQQPADESSSSEVAGRTESTMEVIDLQSQESDPGVDDLMETAVGDRPSDGGHAVTQAEDVAHDEVVEPLPTSVAKSPVTDSEKAAVQESEPDFLQRLTEIEKLLHVANSDSQTASLSVSESTQMVREAAAYWEQFREMTQTLICVQEKDQRKGLSETMDQLVEKVDSQVNACQRIVNEGLASGESQMQLRDRLLGAALGSHELRDQIAMGVATPLMRFHNCTPPDLQHYHEGLSGLQEVLDNWQRQNRDQQVAGLGLIDLNQFYLINQQFGLELADQLLAASCGLISGAVRHNRGYDRLIRIGGQRFLIFFGYTSGQNVCYALERLRQLFGQTDFEVTGELINLHIRGVAADYEASLAPADLLKKLEAGLEYSKAKGGDLVTYCNADGSFQDPGKLPVYDLPLNSIVINKPQMV